MLLGFLVQHLNAQNLGAAFTGLLVSVVLVSWFKPSILPRSAHAALSNVINVYLCWRYPIKDASGSRSLPTCPYSWPNGQGDVAKFLDGIENREKWGKEYGQVYRIWSGFKSEIVLTSSKHIQTVFGDSDKHSKAVNNNAGYIMGQLLGQCVGLVSGRSWQSVRAVAEIPFVHSNVPDLLPLIQKHVDTYMAEIQSLPNLCSGQLHPAADLKFLPFWIVAEVFYGPLPPDLVSWMERLVPQRESLFLQHVIHGGVTSRFSFFKFLPTSANKALGSFKKEWRAFNSAAHDHARTNHPSAPIIAMYAAANAGQITHEQLLQTIDESLFANLDVTIGGLSWIPIQLAANPSAQDQLRAEIRSSLTLSSSPDSYVQSSSTYLASCVLESARLKPLAAFSVPQSAPTPRVVDGFVVPSGTDFIVDSYALNVRDQAFWGDDTDTYNPSRWMNKRPTQLRYHYWRFGFGPRQCMGKYVVEVLIRVLLVHLVSRYRLSLRPEDEGKWFRSAESWITHPDMLIRCVKIQDEEVVVKS